MTFLDALHSGRTLLMDGAMGTELIRRGYRGPTWRANLDAPLLVRSIHAEYVAAGAEVVLTNTFLLPQAGGDIEETARAAIALARDGGARWVLGSIGPATVEKALECAKASRDVDGILLETQSDVSALAAAAAIQQAHPDLPVLVSYSFAPEDEVKAAALALKAERSAIAVLGVNCGREQTPADVGRTLDSFRASTGKPLFARPNAGTPRQVGGRWTYPIDPATWATETHRLCRGGIAMLGGCCGASPLHIGELCRRINEKSPA